MDIAVESVSELTRKVTITLPAKDVRKALDKSYKKLKKDVTLKGFRRGKIPIAVLEKNFGEKVQAEVGEKMVQETYFDAIEEKGIDPEIVNKLDLLGISSIANVMGAIKMARYYEMNENDTIFTVATDSMEMYQSRLIEEREKFGEYNARKADVCFTADLMGLTIDNMIEMTYYEKRRMHNLKYFTWIEQQGKTVEELNAQWYDENYWKHEYAKVEEWDQEIMEFNERTGVLKNL